MTPFENNLNLLFSAGSGLSAANDYRRQQQDLAGLYTQNSPYAQQLAQQLARADAAKGRRSQYGTRNVELQARLADINSRNAAQRKELSAAKHKAVGSVLKDGVAWYKSGGDRQLNTLLDLYRRKTMNPAEYEASSSFMGPRMTAPTNEFSLDNAGSFFGDGADMATMAGVPTEGTAAGLGDLAAAQQYEAGLPVAADAAPLTEVGTASTAQTANPFMDMMGYAGYIPAGVNANRQTKKYGSEGDIGGQIGTIAGTVLGAYGGPLGSLAGSQFGGRIGSSASKGAADIEDAGRWLINGIGDPIGDIFGW